MESHTPSTSESNPTSKRLYKAELSQWARDIIDMALDSGMRVENYDGVLQPYIYLLNPSEFNKPPFMELAGKQLFIGIPHNDYDYGHTLHLRLEGFYWRFANPSDPEEIITLLLYAPKPKEEENVG